MNGVIKDGRATVHLVTVPDGWEPFTISYDFEKEDYILLFLDSFKAGEDNTRLKLHAAARTSAKVDFEWSPRRAKEMARSIRYFKRNR